MHKKLIALLVAAAMVLPVMAACTKTAEPTASPAVNNQPSAAPADGQDPAQSPGTVPSDAKEIETDILIIGAGGTGLTAALSAAESGKKVVLIEKMGLVGGATAMAAGLIPAAYTQLQKDANVEDSVTAMARDILRPGLYSQNMELVRRICEGASDYVDWSASKGVKWSLQTSSLYYGQSTYRIHAAEGAGAGIVAALEAAIQAESNITLMLDTKATGLVTENGAVMGCIAESKADGNLNIKAKSTILATSGFGNNPEMVKKYTPLMSMAIPMVAPGATGEGILWGEELGAEVRNMTAYQAYGPCSAVTKKTIGQTILTRGGIMINNDSERFMNEYTGYSETGAFILAQPGATAWMIWTGAQAEGLETTIDALKEANALYEGKDAAELAKAIGLDEAKVKKELDKYIEGIAKGEDYMNRTKLPKDFAGPYFATQVTGDFRHTQGGLVVNENAQVVKTDGSVIANLYAGGGVTEGFSSAGGPGYMSGNGLLQAFVLGRVAAKSAVENAK